MQIRQTRMWQIFARPRTETTRSLVTDNALKIAQLCKAADHSGKSREVPVHPRIKEEFFRNILIPELPWLHILFSCK